jgi:IPT/TIG domain
MRHQPVARALPILAIFAALAVLAGCTGNSPTEPAATPTPPSPPPTTGSFTVTVTSSLAQLAVGSPDPAILTVQVRQSNGQPPANGTTVVLSASLGALGSTAGPRSVALSLTGGLAQTTFFAGTIVGTAVIQAQISGSIGQTTVEIREPDVLFIAAVSPSSGSTEGGDTVTISGSGFASPIRVTFGGSNAQVVSSTANQIRVITPPSPGGATATLSVAVTVTIKVNLPDQASDSLAGAFTFTAAPPSPTPQPFASTPTGGPNEGGTRVTITGTGFAAPVQVLFGSGSATSFQGQEATVESVTSTRIVVRSPSAQGIGQSNLNQLVAILIRNLNTGLSGVLPSAFQYGGTGSSPVLITSISPGSGDYRGGELVTLFGQGFAAPVAVQFGGLPQVVISVTATEVVVRTVAARVSNCAISESGFSSNAGVVHLVNINTGDGGDGPSFEYLIPKPLIIGVSPGSGPAGGGTNVTISGSGFEPPVRVLFGSGANANAGSVNSATATSISVGTPAFTGTFPTRACSIPAPMMGDPDIPGSQELPASVNVQVINLTTGCTDTLPGGFIYNPTGNCVPN